jgi:linoleate 10R-lipoxygenase
MTTPISTDGQGATNGAANGTSIGTNGPTGTSNTTVSKALATVKPHYTSSAVSTSGRKNVKPGREGVVDALAAIAQPIRASRRPLPTQMGNGTYIEQKKISSFREDLKALKWKGKSLPVA